MKATLQLALEALERYQVKRQDFERFADVITAIKEALANHIEDNLTMVAQPEQDADRFCDANCTWSEHHPNCKYGKPEQEPVAKNEEGRITWLVDGWPQNCFLYAEPPKWTPVEIGVDVTSEGAHVVAMYLLPDAVRYVFYSQFHTAPQRTWVGLDNDDLVWIYSNSDKVGQAISNTETKLKEKNA